MAIAINGSGTMTGISVGGLPDGIVDAGTLATNSVDSAELIDGAIDNSHLADDAVDSDEIAAGAIDAAHLASGVGGKIVQVVYTRDRLNTNGTTTMPIDDTEPQKTEGVGVSNLDTAITPTNSSNKLLILVAVNVGQSATPGGSTMAALFQDTTTLALASGQSSHGGEGCMSNIAFHHQITAGTTSSTTFKIRIGYNGAGTTGINGVSSRIHGGASTSSVTIMEIAV